MVITPNHRYAWQRIGLAEAKFKELNQAIQLVESAGGRVELEVGEGRDAIWVRAIRVADLPSDIQEWAGRLEAKKEAAEAERLEAERGERVKAEHAKG